MNEIDIYGAAHGIACANKQTIGEKRDYYITLEQLMTILRQHLEATTKADLPAKK
jgi:hypothetical protein